MKVLGIIITFISCCMCGFIIDWNEKRRIKELELFVYAFELLKADIDYRLTPLKEAALYVASLTKEGVERVFNTFGDELGSKKSPDINVMWETALQKNKGSFHLKEEDYSLLHEFSNACGYLDKNMQKKNIDMLIKRLSGELEVSKEKYRRNSKLNKYLGVLIGACISIFLI